MNEFLCGHYLQIFIVLAHATLAGRALDVDVLVHALDVADGGVEAGGDRVDLHRDGVQTTVQSRETLTRPVLVVSKEVCQACVHYSVIMV